MAAYTCPKVELTDKALWQWKPIISLMETKWGLFAFNRKIYFKMWHDSRVLLKQWIGWVYVVYWYKTKNGSEKRNDLSQRDATQHHRTVWIHISDAKSAMTLADRFCIGFIRKVLKSWAAFRLKLNLRIFSSADVYPKDFLMLSSRSTMLLM